jgi:hypothetical protein
VDLIPWKDVRKMKEMAEVMYRVSKQVYEARKAVLGQGGEISAKQVSDGTDLMTVLRESVRLPSCYS